MFQIQSSVFFNPFPQYCGELSITVIIWMRKKKHPTTKECRSACFSPSFLLAPQKKHPGKHCKPETSQLHCNRLYKKNKPKQTDKNQPKQPKPQYSCFKYGEKNQPSAMTAAWPGGPCWAGLRSAGSLQSQRPLRQSQVLTLSPATTGCHQQLLLHLFSMIWSASVAWISKDKLCKSHWNHQVLQGTHLISLPQ